MDTEAITLEIAKSVVKHVEYIASRIDEYGLGGVDFMLMVEQGVRDLVDATLKAEQGKDK